MKFANVFSYYINDCKIEFTKCCVLYYINNTWNLGFVTEDGKVVPIDGLSSINLEMY